MRSVLLATVVFALGCSSVEGGMDCAQDGACPSGLTCFPDWRCYPPDATPECAPACWGEEPLCDRATLRCVACLADTDCGVGTICSSPTQRCVAGCTAAHPSCKPGEGTCDVAAGVCRGCNTDTECKDPAAPRCDLEHGRCLACVPDRDDCPAGKHCLVAEEHASCVPGCKDDKECAGGACCNGACVDTMTDANHCGGCDNLCRAGKVCCGGECADLASDVEHCGTCDTNCELPYVSSPACVASKCTNKGCESFFGDCDGNPKNGCETNLTMDPANCFKCGAACVPAPHRVPTCSVSGCVVGPCETGWADCDGNATNGCETSGACP